MIIGFAGKKRSGKDTIADFLCKNHGFTKFAFGDAVKEVSHHLLGFTKEQLYGNNKEVVDPIIGISPRESLQKIGTEFGRIYLHQLFPTLRVSKGTLWTHHFERFVDNHPNGKIVISDVRFANEIDAIHRKGGKIYYVDSAYAEHNDSHVSEEIGINSYEYDGVINNKGTITELYDKCSIFT